MSQQQQTKCGATVLHVETVQEPQSNDTTVLTAKQGPVNGAHLVEKLRRLDPDQYNTLVRMHLSFCLDLSTEEYDSTRSEGRLPKWSLTPFTKKSNKYQVKGVMDGAPLTQEGVCQVYQLIEYIGRDYNICQEGLFRRSGRVTRQHELKFLLNQGIPLNLDEESYSIHECCSVLKNFLASLSEPLLTDAHYAAHCQVVDMWQEGLSQEQQENIQSRQVKALQLLFLLLPSENYCLLQDILMLLHKVASHEEQNKMSAANLATMFVPHILCPRKITAEGLQSISHILTKAVTFMIEQALVLFLVPPELLQDIRVYLAEASKTVIMSGQKNQVSVDDSTAANTVFTFVDREKTAQVNSGDPTEAALAELYAYVQTLPESSKKRKLIKQFNKESGRGTPILGNSMHKEKHARSTSLGESIKKHLFQRGTKQQLKSNSYDNRLHSQRSSSEEVLNSPDKTMPPQKLKCLHESTEDLSTESTCFGRSPRLIGIPNLKKSLLSPQSLYFRSHRKKPKMEGTPEGANIMTPRSRKPVILISGSNISHGLGYHGPRSVLTGSDLSRGGSTCTSKPGFVKYVAIGVANSLSAVADCSKRPNSDNVEEKVTTPETLDPVNNTSCSRAPRAERVTADSLFEFPNNAVSQTETDDTQSECTRSQTEGAEELADEPKNSLTCVFKDYLMSRSVLTASPVDLSLEDLSEGSSSPDSAAVDTVSHDSAYQSRSLNSFNSCSSLGSLMSGDKVLSDSLLYYLEGNSGNYLRKLPEGSTSTLIEKVEQQAQVSKSHNGSEMEPCLQLEKIVEESDNVSQKEKDQEKQFSNSQVKSKSSRLTPSVSKNSIVFETAL